MGAFEKVRDLFRRKPLTEGEPPDEYYELAFRPLSEREREILDFLLTAEVPGIEKLREQAETARAVRYSSRDPSFGLWLDREGALTRPGGRGR